MTVTTKISVTFELPKDYYKYRKFERSNDMNIWRKSRDKGLVNYFYVHTWNDNVDEGEGL